VYIIELDEYQNKLLYIGFDKAERNLEVVTERTSGEYCGFYRLFTAIE
jgi:hypothetical protein